MPAHGPAPLQAGAASGLPPQSRLSRIQYAAITAMKNDAKSATPAMVAIMAEYGSDLLSEQLRQHREQALCRGMPAAHVDGKYLVQRKKKN